MRIRIASTLAALLAASQPIVVYAEVSSSSIPMNFEACLAKKESVIAALGMSPTDIIPVVNTGILTITRVCTVDGSVLITCSKPDQKMIVTRSTDTCGD